MTSKLRFRDAKTALLSCENRGLGGVFGDVCERKGQPFQMSERAKIRNEIYISLLRITPHISRI